MANILITAPSLNENVNISGISSLTKTIITNSTSQTYFHFTIGKKDSASRGLHWITAQILLLPRFIGFVKKNKIDLVHLNTDLTRPSIIRDYIISTVASRILKKRILLHIHGGYLLMRPPKKNTLWYLLINGMLKNAAIKVVLSDIEQREIFIAYGASCTILPNAVEAVGERIIKDFSEKLSLLFIGRIVKAKGIFMLGECLSELCKYFREITLKIYGSGTDLQDFQQQLSCIPGLNYEYCGVANGKEKVKAYKEAHIFLLPSLYGEGMPIAMLESMNYGCVPVVSDDASIGMVVKDGINGYLVSKGDIRQLKDKLISVFDNREKLKELSINAKNTIDRSYNFTNYLTALNQLYAIQ